MAEIVHNCGSQFDPGHVDFSSAMSGDVNHKVRQMLSMADIPQAGDIADRFFPNSISGHRSLTHDRKNAFYRSKAVEDAVRKMYAVDYDLIKRLDS
mmetsp:Transcript_66001/g.183850  ORF Transcript_66001/g.183850 Transcript_66001/m.183850 type:complete len:96 (+) Transcript_66001:3-290(+)